MSCSFWNMRRRLKAQKNNDKVITDIATAQAKEKQEEAVAESKPAKKGGAKKNDNGTV